MKKIALLIISLCALPFIHAQSLEVTPDGLRYGENEYIVIEAGDTSIDQLVSLVSSAIKTKHQSPTIEVEKSKENQLIVSDLVKGFTKTDRKAGSAYLFDLNYKFTIDFKDGRIRISIPVISIGSQNKFYSNNNQFKLSMGIIGKSDVWSNDEKKFFIYNEKGKLVEKSTRGKLENLFNELNEVITNSIASNDDW